MSTPLTGADIIKKFELYVGDQSELSTQEELDLLNKVYDDTLNQMPYEFLKKSVAGSITVSGGQAYITLPTDFRYLIENNNFTDIARGIPNNATPKVIFVGVNYQPYQVVNWSDRRQYRDNVGFAYLDKANNRIVFTAIPNELTYEFDYISNWEALTLTTSPIFPADLHDMLFQGMAVDSTIINLFDKTISYAKENQAAYDDMIKKLRYYNSMLINN